MTRFNTAVVSVLFVSLAAAHAKADTLTFSGPIGVTYYDGFTETLGVGIVFSDRSSSETMASLDELRDIGGADSSPGWPDGSQVFGADFTGVLSAPSAGNYALSFGTDDAGYLFIDGVQVAAQPGLHAFSATAYMTGLTAGAHSFEIQYDNAGAGGAVAQFDPGDAISAAVPEPAAWALMVLGLAAMGTALRRTRAQRELAA